MKKRKMTHPGPKNTEVPLQAVLLLLLTHLCEHVSDALEQLALCLPRPKHGRHLVPHVSDQQHVDLACPHSLDKLIDLAVAAVGVEGHRAELRGPMQRKCVGML